jgi:hypothetical protein
VASWRRALGIGDGDDALRCFCFAEFCLKLLFEHTESDGRFGSGTRFGYYDDTEFLSFEEILEFIEIILTDVLSGKQHLGCVALTVSGK